jgi:hypothetical protein
MPSIALAAISFGLVAFLIHRFIETFLLSPLSRIPGPKAFALSKWRLAWEDWTGNRTRKIGQLHLAYGPVVRVGPEEVAFNSVSALRTIYGAGSGFERTSFYSMFDVYGKKNLFTFHSSKDHADRKKLLAHAYSKSTMLKPPISNLIQAKVKGYLDLIDRGSDSPNEIFSSLHYFALDTITDFVYGDFGKTESMSTSQEDRNLIGDIIDISRRKLSWFAVHWPSFTKWLYSRTGLAERLARHLYPMQKPTTYTGIRAHALQAWNYFLAAPEDIKSSPSGQYSIIGKLWKHHQSQKQGGLGDMDIASECADHLLAGIDTTSDTLMFLIWALSIPKNKKYQEKLFEEVNKIAELNEDSIPSLDVCDRLGYLDAVIKETLRLYAPLPASEPRSLSAPISIDGYLIPARTVVSMSPYSLHRNPTIFKEPLEFNPDRWLGGGEEVSEMKRWWWAFSSGGRMCIGMQ